MTKKVRDIAKALASQRESKHLEFKEKFDHADAQDSCEIIKAFEKPGEVGSPG
jgi:hypothetical protein